jgi:hypothetical protein
MCGVDGLIEQLDGEQFVWLNVTHCEVKASAVEIEESTIRSVFIDLKASELWTDGNTVLVAENSLQALTL